MRPVRRTLGAVGVILWAGFVCDSGSAQTTFRELAPGTSTRADVERVLGRPTRALDSRRVEYGPSEGIARVEVEFDASSVVQRIAVFLERPATRRALVARFGLPEGERLHRLTPDGRLIEYFEAPALIAFTYASADGASGVTVIDHHAPQSFTVSAGGAPAAGAGAVGAEAEAGGAGTAGAPPARAGPATVTRPAESGSSVACGHVLGTAIYAKWLETGGERGVLGCAKMDEAEAGRSPLGTTGRYAKFRGTDDGLGAIHWHATGPHAGKAFVTYGCIYLLFSKMGGSVSALGFPVGDEYDVPQGRRSDFEGGSIVFERQNATAAASGPSIAGYFLCSAGGER